VPKMLRVYFLHHRELLGALSLAAHQTVKELMAAAVEEKGFRPGVVSVVQTFGGPGDLPFPCPRAGFPGRLVGFRGVDPGAVCG
jgi:hypothetical protein